ncbi:hypothetical protein WJX75_006741 [Coccomyxa subellipsoidea]|uniref:Protein kinase domain-containing protein n=1 Tax=Coccomyxa subellipsoidea TaxID=248742 RepID=A0ABR2YP29_9CHLO
MAALERAVSVINRILSKAQGSSAKDVAARNKKNGKWVKFTVKGSGKAAVRERRAAGRSVANYLALPVEEYSLLDPSWIKREPGSDIFCLSAPLRGITGVDLEPTIWVSVVSDPDSKSVSFSSERASLGDATWDEKFSLSFSSSLTYVEPFKLTIILGIKAARNFSCTSRPDHGSKAAAFQRIEDKPTHPEESTANAEEQETPVAMKELERETSRLILKLVAVEEARQKDAELYEARLRTQADHIEDLNASLEEARQDNLEDVAVYEAGMEIQAVRIQTVRAKCDALAQDLKDAHDNHVNSLHAQAKRMKVLRVSRDQTQEHCRQLEETVTNCQSTIQSQEGEIERLREVLGETSRELQQAKSLPPVQPTRTLPRVPKGTVIRCETEEEAASGSHGMVYPVEVTFPAAAKEAHPGDACRDDLVHEAAVITAIGPHQNVIGLIGWASTEDMQDDKASKNESPPKDVLLMELAEGSLEDEIDVDEPMERIQALSIVHQICEGTKHIHGAGHMHCDLKTDNVLLMENGSAKIADFGCAAPNASRALGHFRGTFTTQTPKTAMKARQQGEADDRRAVSAIALEVFSGRSLHAALGEQYEQLSDGCKAELEAICQELYPHMARKKGLPRCLLMAAAEHYGKIRIQQVVPIIDGLPQELLDAVVLGINDPDALSLDSLQDFLTAAMKACTAETAREAQPAGTGAADSTAETSSCKDGSTDSRDEGMRGAEDCREAKVPASGQERRPPGDACFQAATSGMETAGCDSEFECIMSLLLRP